MNYKNILLILGVVAGAVLVKRFVVPAVVKAVPALAPVQTATNILLPG